MLQVGEEETFHMKYFKIIALQGLHHYAVKFAMQWLRCTTEYLHGIYKMFFFVYLNSEMFFFIVIL